MKSTLGEGGDRSARTNPLRKNKSKKNPRGTKPSGSMVQFPMSKHVLDLIFKP